eukprot:COSAG02_NODE_2812_length_7975_cov_110.220543_6_plen_164_part_00
MQSLQKFLYNGKAAEQHQGLELHQPCVAAVTPPADNDVAQTHSAAPLPPQIFAMRSAVQRTQCAPLVPRCQAAGSQGFLAGRRQAPADTRSAAPAAPQPLAVSAGPTTATTARLWSQSRAGRHAPMVEHSSPLIRASVERVARFRPGHRCQRTSETTGTSRCK